MRKNIHKLALGAILAALSVTLKLVFDVWIKIPGFGFPFYGIPLILAGLYLGPLYGFIVAIVADTTYGTFQGYLPLYAISSIAWAFIPSLFRTLFKNKVKISYLVLIVLLTYVVASLSNTLATYIHFGKKVMLGTLYYRLAFIPLFSPIIAIIVSVVYNRTINYFIFLKIEEDLI